MFEDIRLPATKRDKDGAHTRLALAALNRAAEIRREYDLTLHTAIDMYGDLDGRTPTSGVYNADWPEDIKTAMRALLQRLNMENSSARVHWALSGRRESTLMLWYQLARQLPDGRVSYY